MKRHHEPPDLLYFSGFPGWLPWFSLQICCLNNKTHFSLANANNSASFKRKMVKNLWFCSFTNKLVNEAANDSAQVSGQDRKKTARSQAKKKSYVTFIAGIFWQLYTLILIYTERTKSTKMVLCLWKSATPNLKMAKQPSEVERLNKT